MSFLFRSHTQSIPCYTEQKNQIKSHHFCLKVLTAMYELQSGNSSYINGIKSRDIMRYMQEKFELDGDIKTQVHISLQQSLAYGFITKEFGKYKLVGPMAKVIQEPHDSKDRFNEIERVVKIFWSTRKFPSIAAQQGKYVAKSSQVNLTDEQSSSECNQDFRGRQARKKRHHSPLSEQHSVSSMQSGSTVLSNNTSVISTSYDIAGLESDKQETRRRLHKRPRRARRSRRRKHNTDVSSNEDEGNS